MQPALAGPVLFAVWWGAWTLVWVIGVLPRRRSGRLWVLLAYEITLVPMVLLVAALTWWSPASLPSGVTSWAWWAVPLVAVPAGALTWLVLTGGQGRSELVPGQVTRRLLIGVGTNAWSALGEEVAFRLLLLGGLTLVWQSVWPAWLLVSLAFGLHHLPVGGRRLALVHTGSGAVFGLLFVLGGGLAAAVAAHVTYNVLSALTRESELRRAARGRRRLGLRG